jgi:hypothetical protein
MEGVINPSVVTGQVSREEGPIRRAIIFTQSIGPSGSRKTVKGKGPRQRLDLKEFGGLNHPITA